MTTEHIRLSQIKLNPDNPRGITRERFELLVASILVFPKMLELRPIVLDREHVALGGNMRARALEKISTMTPEDIADTLMGQTKFRNMTGGERQALMEYWVTWQEAPDAPILWGDNLSDFEREEFIAKDNENFGFWDFDILANKMDAALLQEWGINVWQMEAPAQENAPDSATDSSGDSGSSGASQTGSDQEGSGTDADSDEHTSGVSEHEVSQRCASGDLWRLGRHLLLCGDSLEPASYARLMGTDKATLCFTDPPYGMGKEIDGVANDNQNADELLEFNRRWIPLTLDALKDNGSWYCWGLDEPLMDIYAFIMRPMIRRNEVTFRNYITWAKHSAYGVNSDLMRQFPRETEKALFFMKGVEGFNNNSDHFPETHRALLEYMEGEARRVGLTPKLLRQITGTQMYSHWFTTSQFAPIPEKHLLKLREHFGGQAFLKSHDELLAMIDHEGYASYKEAEYSRRAYFDNTHNKDSKEIMTDVWRFCATTQKEREDTGGHATPKPQTVCQRGVLSSSREGDIVLDVFGGSGSMLIACEKLNRECRMMELLPHYCDVIIARWEKVTGQKAEKVNG